MNRQTLKTREDISSWLDAHEIYLYTIHNDLSVDVNADVSLQFKKLEYIPLQFNHIDGSFSCYNNPLKSLKGSPFTVEKNFLCASTDITSLEFSPRRVGKNFSFSYNKIKTLKGISNVIGGNITGERTPLINIDDLPVNFNGIFHHQAKDNLLISGFEIHYHEKDGFQNLSLTGNEIRKIQEYHHFNHLLPSDKISKRSSTKI